MICYYYPPIKSMGVMRAYALSHEWLNYFESVSVITTNNKKRLQSEQMPIDSRIKVGTVSTVDYRTLTSLFSSKSHYSESSKKSWFGQFIVKVLNSFPFNLWLGEGGFWYARNAYRMAKREIENSNIQYIYSSFRPYSDHSIACKLKKKFPHLRWLADYRDIHVDALKNNVFFSNYQHWMSQKILSEADVVSTVSKGCAKHIQQYTTKKVHVIYNGVHDVEHANSKLNDEFTITYTGSLYGDMRNPSIVLKAIGKLLNEDFFRKGIRIVYAGKDTDKWNQWIEEYQLKSHSVNVGLCSYDESRSLQQRSHINLQLTFSHPEVTGAITGKLMEYLQAKRPIICVINGSKDDEIEAFLNGKSAVTVYNSTEYLPVVLSFIKEMYSNYLNDDLDSFDVNHKSLPQVTWSYLANKFVNSINETIGH